MAEAQERNLREDIPAAPDPKPASEEAGYWKKKKKKKSGCGFFLFLIMLAIGAAAGLQASGGADLRPYVYQVVPKIPYVGESLKDLLSIPDTYAMTAEERRRVELEDWENRIADTVRSIDEREQHLNALSDDLGALGQTLESERAEIAARLEALSGDMAERGLDAGAPQGGNTGDTGIEETIRTFQDMSPRNAASILEKLDEKLAVTILDGLPQDSRGTLLGRMDAEKAARLTEQLTELQKRRQRQQGR